VATACHVRHARQVACLHRFSAPTATFVHIPDPAHALSPVHTSGRGIPDLIVPLHHHPIMQGAEDELAEAPGAPISGHPLRYAYVCP